MRQQPQNVAKMATKLIVDYGDEAEDEAIARAELLHALGSRKEADLWLSIMAEVANLRAEGAGPTGARGA